MPTSDLGIGLNRKVSHISEIHRRTKREIRDRQRIAGNKFLALELPVQHLCCAVERFRCLGNGRRIGLAALDHYRFDDVFENEYRARRIPMREIPELPARHVDAPPFILGRLPGFLLARYWPMALDSQRT